jgi:hypothetical protein
MVVSNGHLYRDKSLATAVDYWNRAGSAAARLNQSDIVFIFSIRLEPTKTLQGSG